ncbi:MAG: hypothetical protein WCV82_00775 [Candidatus Paceibacterota bacterium]
MKTKYIVLTVVLVLIIGGIYLLKPTQSTIIDRGYPASLDYQSYSIHELKEKSLQPGSYNTEGYVVKRYECPPCPAGAQCKPCMRNNIVISENNIPLKTYNLSNTELVIFVDYSQRFEIGKKYRFSIKLLDSNTTDEAINDVELVGFNQLESDTK